MDGDGCSFFFTVPGWVPPLEAAVKWLDANTAIQTKKTGWIPRQQYKQKNWLDANAAIQTKNWLDANAAIQTKNWLDANAAIQTKNWLDAIHSNTNKKIGWMPTQQCKQKNWLDANTALQTEKTTTVG